MRNHFTLWILLLTGSFSAHAAVDAGLLALVPSGSKIITSIDIQSARSSDFGQYLLSRISGEDESFQELARQTGFDPRRDLQDFVFASAGPTSDKANQFAILARGNFDSARIGAAAKAKGAVIQKYQGVDLILNPPSDSRTALAFPDIGVAVLGDVDTVQQIISNRSNPSTLDPALQQSVSKVGSDNDAWFASSLAGSYLSHRLNQSKQPAQVPAQALQFITESSGGIRFGGDVQLSFDAVTRSPKDASSLADVIRFLASLAQMQAQKSQTAQQTDLLAPALANMDLKTDGNSMHLSLSLPEKSLEQLAESGVGVNARRTRPTTR